jgi:hypothetical protein
MPWPPSNADWRRALQLVTLMAVVYAGYEFGRATAGYSITDSLLQRQRMAARIDDLADDLDQVRRQLAASEVIHKVDAQAQSGAQAALAELQAEVARQQQELDFYRELVSDKFGSDTLRIQELEVRPVNDLRHTLILTLVHGGVTNRSVSGWLTFALSGSEDGRPRRLRLKELSPGREERIDFALRNFTTLQVSIDLPERFTPEMIEVDFRLLGGSGEPLRQSFPWSRGASPGTSRALTGGGRGS